MLKSIFLLAVLCCSTLVHAQSYTSWFTGNTADVNTAHQSGLLLAGGGTDNEDAMRWFLQKAQGGDVVVIRASGSDGYNTFLFTELGITVHSVETLLIPSKAAAEDPYVAQQIRNAEALFIAGGDQYQYHQFWKDTPVEAAINYLLQTKKAVVGGTSAGMMILGKAYYTPSGSGITSAEAMANPYHPNMNLLGKKDFIVASFMYNTINDTHFDQRTRAGRLVTFLARMEKDWETNAQGIACNEHTAVAVDETGKARVFGSAANDIAYFLQTNGVYPNSAPEVCQTETSLKWQQGGKAIKVYKVLGTTTGANFFQLSDWRTGEGGSWENWTVSNNVLTKTATTEMPALPTGEIQVKQNGQNILTNNALSIGFSVVGQPAIPITFTITNTGEKPLMIQKPVSTLADFVVNASFINTTLPVEGSITFTVTYQPIQAQAHEGVINIPTDDPDENPFMLKLAGLALATPIETVWWKDKIRLYPNPVLDTLHVNLENLQGKKVKITLKNAQGKTIRTYKTFESLHLPVNDLSQGVYYLQLQTEKHKTVLTFVKY